MSALTTAVAVANVVLTAALSVAGAISRVVSKIVSGVLTMIGVLTRQHTRPTQADVSCDVESFDLVSCALSQDIYDLVSVNDSDYGWQ